MYFFLSSSLFCRNLIFPFNPPILLFTIYSYFTLNIRILQAYYIF
nr:MAG TPA: hypothetical protein [Caudoviricetes sp.]